VSDLARATAGEEVQVDYSSIEKSLAELWRAENTDPEHAVTRAALWNVVAHTGSQEHHTHASETLARASASVPQRTIIVRANPSADAELASWISANCHLAGGGKQVCSEEIAIVAGGEHVQRVPPLVNALLIPDMPVAVWWIGDLPNENESYVTSLLEPADRIMVDSVHFDRAADLDLVHRVGRQTTTAPADLNWIRLEEWRAATAAVFDPPTMRERLRKIRAVRVAAMTTSDFFGQMVEALYYSAWLMAQLGHEVDESGKVEGPEGSIDYRFERRSGGEAGTLAAAEVVFEDGSQATITRDAERGVVMTNIDGNVSIPDAVTRTLGKRQDELIVRLLKRPEGDRLLLKVLPLALRVAKRLG
jgi:glucose-6-phosphate dehydrogenase assembly protein OpcA